MINEKDLAALNAVLGKDGIQAVPAPAGVKAPVCADTVSR